MQRWLLLNDKNDDDAWIDAMVERAAVALAVALDDDVEVVSSRDDFKDNASGKGAWKTWPAEMANRVNMYDEYVYDGLVRPVSSERGLVVGRGNYAVLDAFLHRPQDPDSYTVAAWNVGDDTFADIEPGGFDQVTALKRLPGDNWVSYGVLDVPGAAFNKKRTVLMPRPSRSDTATVELTHDQEEFCQFCRDACGTAESLNKPHQQQFRQSVTEKLTDMHDKVASGRYPNWPTPGQWQAALNMQRGVEEACQN